MIRFLGGIKFAIMLIASAALFVISGTILESMTDSHLYAAAFTYDNPLFTALLGLFFVNILVSALRRWPFQKRHVPFLITHLGLLMVLSGVIIKNIWGIQGALTIWEGSGSHDITISNTQVVEVEEHDTKRRTPYAIEDLDILSRLDHSEKRWESWIKSDKLHITGLPPIPLNEKTRIRLHGPESTPWTLFGCYADDVDAMAKHLFQEGLEIELFDRLAQQKSNPDAMHLHLDSEPHLEITYKKATATLDLTHLKWENQSTQYIGSPPFTVDLKREPLVAFIKDRTGDVHLFAFDPHGRVHRDTFSHNSWSSLVVYDEGYAGYAAQTKIPFLEQMPSRKEIEATLNTQLKQALKAAASPLSPPLEMLRKSCLKHSRDFAEVCLSFLQHWDSTHRWLYPNDAALPGSIQSVFESLQWKPNDLKAAQWIASLYPSIEQGLAQGRTLSNLLEEMHWPIHADSLTEWAQQIYTVADRLPETGATAHQAKLFSALLRAYGIHYADILPNISFEPEATPTLESPMSLVHRPLPTLKKLEENRPAIQFRFDGDIITLGYDPYGIGLRWPTKSGKHLLHYRPRTETIPYHVRVRDARQINYANSNQPYSYECDAVIGGVETTLSMNEIYETWDGYRFYLAAISPGTPGEVQQVRIVVNRDPTKYWLTYPGAIILTLGIILVFWFRKS